MGSLFKPFLWALCLAFIYLAAKIYIVFIQSPLSSIPGPRVFAITKWRLALEDYRGTRTRYMQILHEKYGAVVRIGPNEVSFNSLSALRTLYGAGTVFQRNDFYRMFDVYGRRNLFTFGPSSHHRDRKKILNHAYSKSVILSPRNAGMVEGKVKKFMELIRNEADHKGNLEIFSTLHCFSLDTITHFLYGKSSPGATAALSSPTSPDRSLLDDIIDPARRKLSWFTIHRPSLTRWLYSRSSSLESILSSLHLLPMLRPTTYTGIRTYALKAAEQVNRSATLDSNESIAERLFLASRKENLKTETPLEFLDIASECADHLLAGIDTTSDTLMWAIFLLSQSENHVFQDKLREEIQSLQVKSDDDDVVNAPLADTLPYLNAIIKETLRLFPPLPGTEPRISETDQIVDGYTIPAGTTVSISPYTLHRNADVFEEPERFNPKRWLSTGSGSDSGEEDARLAEMKRWFWAFSSGGRMCIGMHLAMAEMTTLLASVYRVYKTEIASGFRGVSPGVTARYEVFYDDRFPRMEEHACWVRFVKD